MKTKDFKKIATHFKNCVSKLNVFASCYPASKGEKVEENVCNINEKNGQHQRRKRIRGRREFIDECPETMKILAALRVKYASEYASKRSNEPIQQQKEPLISKNNGNYYVSGYYRDSASTPRYSAPPPVKRGIWSSELDLECFLGRDVSIPIITPAFEPKPIVVNGSHIGLVKVSVPQHIEAVTATEAQRDVATKTKQDETVVVTEPQSVEPIVVANKPQPIETLMIELVKPADNNTDSGKQVITKEDDFAMAYFGKTLDKLTPKEYFAYIGLRCETIPPEESTEESSANRIEQSQSEQQASPQLEQQVSAQSVVEKLLVKRLWVENALPEIVSSSIAQLEQSQIALSAEEAIEDETDSTPEEDEDPANIQFTAERPPRTDAEIALYISRLGFDQSHLEKALTPKQLFSNFEIVEIFKAFFAKEDRIFKRATGCVLVRTPCFKPSALKTYLFYHKQQKIYDGHSGIHRGCYQATIDELIRVMKYVKTSEY